MLTKHEAYQRCHINNVRLERRFDQWRVTLNEWPNGLRSTEDKAYYTDDLDDAVLTGAEMRYNETRRVA